MSALPRLACMIKAQHELAERQRRQRCWQLRCAHSLSVGHSPSHSGTWCACVSEWTCQLLLAALPRPQSQSQPHSFCRRLLQVFYIISCCFAVIAMSTSRTLLGKQRTRQALLLLLLLLRWRMSPSVELRLTQFECRHFFSVVASSSVLPAPLLLLRLLSFWSWSNRRKAFHLQQTRALAKSFRLHRVICPLGFALPVYFGPRLFNFR